MVFLGGTPAALIGVVDDRASAGSAGATRRDFLLNNLVTYASFPLVGGLAFHAAHDAARRRPPATPLFYLLVFGAFVLALAINFLDDRRLHAATSSGAPSRPRSAAALIPLLPSELAAALMAVGVAYLYVQVGIAAIALFGDRPGHLPVPARPAAALPAAGRGARSERGRKQLASFQVGMLSALLRTLDLRDQMTARHCAAVARYSRAIAQRGRLLARTSRSSSTSPRCCTTSASSSSPTGSSRPTCRSPTRTGC